MALAPLVKTVVRLSEFLKKALAPDPNLKAETVRGSKHVLESVKEPNIKRTEEGITIKEAKERLSIEYAIPEDSIEIILKG